MTLPVLSPLGGRAKGVPGLGGRAKGVPGRRVSKDGRTPHAHAIHNNLHTQKSSTAHTTRQSSMPHTPQRATTPYLYCIDDTVVYWVSCDIDMLIDDTAPPTAGKTTIDLRSRFSFNN